LLEHDPYGNRHRMPVKMNNDIHIARDKRVTPKPFTQSSVYNSYVPKNLTRTTSSAEEYLPPIQGPGSASKNESVRQSMPDPDVKCCFNSITLPEEKMLPPNLSYVKKPKRTLTETEKRQRVLNIYDRSVQDIFHDQIKRAIK